MVVEELVAKLGFKVDGLGELKKFENGLKHAKDGVSRFGTAMNKWVGNLKIGSMNGIGAIGGKLAQGFRSAASSIAIAAAGAARMAAGVAAVSAALVGAVALAAKLAYNFVKARGEAAQLRREQQLAAQGDRTKVGNVEGLQKGLDMMAASGALKDVAKSFVGNIAKEADAAIRGEGDEKYKKNKIDLLDKKTGIQRDTTAVALDVLSKYADMVKDGQIARREAAIAQAKGDRKGETSAIRRANKSELEARKFASDFGIDGPLKAALDELRNGAAQFREIMEKAAKFNPGKTADQEDAAKQRAQRYEDLRQKVEGIGTGLQNAVDSVKDSIADRLMGALDDASSALLGFAKHIGLVAETKGEVQDRAKAKADAAKDPAGIAAAQKAADEALKKSTGGAAGSFARWLFGMGDAADQLIEASKAYKSAKANREANAGGNVSKEAAAGVERIYQEAAKAFLDAFQKVQDVQRQNTPDAASKKASEKVEKKEDRRSYNDIGNDKRNMPITLNQTINGLENVLAAAKNGILGAISTKAANTSTAALNAP